MKPMKKKNIKTTKPKDTVDTKSTKKINNYFESASKPFVIEKIGDAESTKSFYVQTLHGLLDDTSNRKPNTAQGTADCVEFTDGACALTLDEITVSGQSEKSEKCADCVEKDKQLRDWEEKFKSLQKTYLTQCHHFSELTIKHKVLLSSVKSSPPSSNDVAVTECNDDIFSTIELKILENMSLDKKKDSTFVHQCLEFAYKNDLASFSNKTLKGVPESVKFDANGQEIHIPKKDPFTPEKVTRIRQLFVERISKCTIDSASFEARIKDANFNKIFASCVKNISNKNN